MRTTRLGTLPIWTVSASDTNAMSALATVRQRPDGFALVQNAERCLIEIEAKDGVSITRQPLSLHPSFAAAVSAAVGMFR